MNPQEIRQICEAMRDCGVTHLKMHDLELSIQTAAQPVSAPQMSPQTPASEAPPSMSGEQKDAIIHKIEETAALLRLPDEQLIDQMFPLPREPEDIPSETGE